MVFLLWGTGILVEKGEPCRLTGAERRKSWEAVKTGQSRRWDIRVGE